MSNMINEVEQVKYVIKVNGQVVSVAFPSQTLAEQAIVNLPESQQATAQVVPVNAKGQEILLG